MSWEGKLSKVLIVAMVMLLLGSVFSMIPNTANASTLPISQRINPVTGQPYGDIMQYDWPVGGHDEGLTGFNPGPAPSRPNLLWRVSTTGTGHVSVFNGKVFVMEAAMIGITPSQMRLFAYDAFTGELIYAVPAPGTPAPSGTAGLYKLDDTYLLLQGTTGAVCRRIDNGEVVWTLTIPGGMGLPGSGTYFAGHYSESMKKLFTHSWNASTHQGQILAYDLSNPSNPPPLAWRYLADSPSEILCSGDGKLFLGTTEGTVYALNGTTGERVWQTHGKGGLIQQSAIYYNGKLYTSATTTQMTCFDGKTGEILWQYEKGPRAFSAYRGAAGHGMIFDTTVETDPHGWVYAWDAETGEVRWKQPGYYYISYTTMAVADGKVYTTTCDWMAGAVVAGLTMPGYEFSCFDAFTGTLLWKLPGINFAQPTIAYGNLYGIYGGYLYCISDKPKDWTHGFIGNVETGRVAVGQYGPSKLNLKWAFQTGGDVSSSPAVVDGKVYVGSHDKNWYCLDAYTGAKIWNFTIGHYVRSSAAVVGGRVFTGADDGYFYCLNASTGQQIWKTPAGGHFPNMMVPTEFQPRSSPIVIGNRVYVGSLDGKVYCLNAENGNVLYTYSTGGPIFGSPVYYNGIIYITSTDTYLYALNAADLSLKWRSFPLNLQIGIPERSNLFNIGTPTVADGKVFIGGGVMYGTAVPGVNYYPHSVPSGAWGGTIRFFAFNASTGASIWNQTLAGNTQPVWVPVYKDGKLYISEFMQVTCMNATNPNSGPYKVSDFGEMFGARRAGNRTWGQWLGYQISSSVAYADDITGPKVYVGCDIGSVTVLDATNGKPLSSYPTPGNVPSSPAIWDGKVYVGSVNGKVYCFSDAPSYSPEIVAWCDWSEAYAGENIVVHSRLLPGIPGEKLILTLTKPGGAQVHINETTDEKGWADFSFQVDQAGDWTWTVWYEGKDKDYIVYTYAYTDTYPLTVKTAITGPTAPPAIPTEYVIAIAAIIIIIIIAITAYTLKKHKK
ncbi:MAG: PQQ-binding-like beta-propeller repeat protein [Candidatus Bathyarchaeia archaeon]|jgi:outer membrane protein assembly factor BamB|nr:PQQ-binding-like beta-propeller repeat protein [Candidatus Bathyarchaeota archaeon A05DMB-3]